MGQWSYPRVQVSKLVLWAFFIDYTTVALCLQITIKDTDQDRVKMYKQMKERTWMFRFVTIYLSWYNWFKVCLQFNEIHNNFVSKCLPFTISEICKGSWNVYLSNIFIKIHKLVFQMHYNWHRTGSWISMIHWTQYDNSSTDPINSCNCLVWDENLLLWVVVNCKVCRHQQPTTLHMSSRGRPLNNINRVKKIKLLRVMEYEC